MDAYDEGSTARKGPDAPAHPGPPPQPVRPPESGPPRESVRPSESGPPRESVRSPESGPPRESVRSPESGPPRESGSPSGWSGMSSGSQPPGDSLAGIAVLSLPYRIVVALALAVVAVGVCVHVGMTFLHVAPANTVSREHGEAVDDWIYPEFEQNWKLFAPNPLQQNISVQVRASVRGTDGMTITSGWYDLSAEDGRAIDGNPLPSHTQQNELRRAWDFYVATHDSQNRPVGLRGALSEAYLRRIAVLRLDRNDAVRATTGDGGVLERVQVRSRTSNVPPPEWSREKVTTTPSYRELPWWKVPRDEALGGVR
ncbi:DUF5819 family protein [Streptomyces sp. NPDC029554]|uniref:DUF5819 family protein n=1 Tax=Streptomyces sp. NPDC029554 TaxID=3155126 RepID=UPI0033D98BEC